MDTENKEQSDFSFDEVERQKEEELDRKIAKLTAERAQKEALEASELEPPQMPDQELEPQEMTEEEIIWNILEGQGFTRTHLDQARQRFGRVYIFPVSEDRAFVFRGLSRREWNKIRQLVSLSEEDPEEEMKYQLIYKAVIFPKMTADHEVLGELAGVIEILPEIIMTASGFVRLENALAQVREL